MTLFKKDNRGITYQMVMWIPRIFYLITVLAVSFGFIFLFTAIEVDVGDVESHIIMHGMHFSPQGISKFDHETGRVYVGVVDEEKLDGSTLENSFIGRKSALAMKVVKKPLKDPDDANSKTAFIHQKTYTDWSGLAKLVYERGQPGAEPIKGSGRWIAHKEIRYAYSEKTGTVSNISTVVIKPHG